MDFPELELGKSYISSPSFMLTKRFDSVSKGTIVNVIKRTDWFVKRRTFHLSFVDRYFTQSRLYKPVHDLFIECLTDFIRICFVLFRDSVCLGWTSESFRFLFVLFFRLHKH